VAVRKQTRWMKESVEPEYVSVDQAEIMTGVSRWTWRGYCYRGLIDSCKVGVRLLIPLSEIRRVLAEGYRPRVSEPNTKRPRAVPASNGNKKAAAGRR
jgi:hypothetical protein